MGFHCPGTHGTNDGDVPGRGAWRLLRRPKRSGPIFYRDVRPVVIEWSYSTRPHTASRRCPLAAAAAAAVVRRPPDTLSGAPSLRHACATSAGGGGAVARRDRTACGTLEPAVHENQPLPDAAAQRGCSVPRMEGKQLGRATARATASYMSLQSRGLANYFFYSTALSF